MNASAVVTTPSLIDRLIDACEGVSEPRPARVDRLMEDIENLLNTCSLTPDRELAEHPEASQSLLTYGTPAPESLALATHKERLAAARRLEELVSSFEPRLESVQVRIDDRRTLANECSFRLEACLRDEGTRRLSLPIRVRTSSGRAQVTTERS